MSIKLVLYFTIIFIFSALFVNAALKNYDIDNNNRIDINDLKIIGENIRKLNFNLSADVNIDGKVSLFDIVLVARHFGKSIELLQSSAQTPSSITCNGGTCNRSFQNSISLKCSGSGNTVYTIERRGRDQIVLASKDTDSGFTDAVTASDENCGTECKEDAFDQNINTKWLAFSSAAQITYEFKNSPKIIGFYDVTSANDLDGRDPDTWTLQGSDDGQNWDILDARANAASSWTARKQTKRFTIPISNRKQYSFYRLDITNTRAAGGGIVQIAELELLEDATPYIFVGSHNSENSFVWNISNEDPALINLRCKAAIGNESSDYYISSENPRIVVLQHGVEVPLPIANDPNWSLAFQDEFDGSFLDTSKWHHCYQYACTGWWHAEKQWYTEGNVEVSGGTLKLIAKKESQGYQPGDGNTYSWTSGMVQSGPINDPNEEPQFAFRYGYMEGRIKVVDGKGFWPAFWTTGTDEHPPEIDIFEFFSNFNELSQGFWYCQNSNQPGCNGGSKTSWDGDFKPSEQNFAGQFHKFAMEWEPDFIAFYFDDQLVKKYEGSIMDQREVHLRQHILINFAVGAWFLPEPDAATPSPAVMEVDYVRVWQKPGHQVWFG